jgi:arginyl-tRNA synthetase
MTRDLAAAVLAASAAAAAAGELPGLRLPDGPQNGPQDGPWDGLRVSGSWRPVPPGAGGGPGHYATSIPFALAAAAGVEPAQVAAVLAARLQPAGRPGTAGHPGPGGLIEAATVTGPGYLSLTVRCDALQRLAVRISQAGPACARSDALRGQAVAAPRDARLAAAAGWAQAARQLTAELTGRLAAAAGADVTWTGAPRPDPPPPPHPPASPSAGQAPAPRPPVSPSAGQAASPPLGHPSSPVAAAVAFAGEDAIRLALSRLPHPAAAAPPDPRAAAARRLGNPAYAVQYAHAHAASAVRQAADLGFPKGDAERFRPCLLAHPRELALLDALSWLPERVAGAARRGEPHVLTTYLDDLAAVYFDWQERCPLAQPGAFPPAATPPAAVEPAAAEPARAEPAADGPGSPLFQARLWLADATRTTLGAGLGLLGVTAPSRR